MNTWKDWVMGVKAPEPGTTVCDNKDMSLTNVGQAEFSPMRPGGTSSQEERRAPVVDQQLHQPRPMSGASPQDCFLQATRHPEGYSLKIATMGRSVRHRQIGMKGHRTKEMIFM